MHKKVKKLIAILDGTPTNVKGQSLVELTITFPIFMIMLVGMVEIGWFANNYLILSDSVRSAGRFGSLRDPFTWIEGDEKNYNRLDCDLNPDTFNVLTSDPPDNTYPALPGGFYRGGESSDLGYYDSVACAAIVNMLPLRVDETKDEVVVSVFSYARFDDCNGANSASCFKVTGRYPVAQNECPEDYRDPFDFIQNNNLDEEEKLKGRPEFDTTRLMEGGKSNDGYRGYVFRGNQFAEGGACRGSLFSLQNIEELLNSGLTTSPGQSTSAAQLELERSFLPSYGLVLVEIQYHSEQLLNLPFVGWVANPIVIRVWSFFPVSAAEPDVQPSVVIP